VIDPELQDWLLSLDSFLPLQQVRPSDLAIADRQALEQNAPSQTSLIEALLWLRVGVIDRPHELVQDGSQDIEKYLHGVVHRLEGDYWNAKYWFRQVRDEKLLKAFSSSIREVASKEDQSLIDDDQALFHHSLFQPQAFVDAVEKLLASQANSADKARKLSQLSYYEWYALWQAIACRQAKSSIPKQRPA
jgi:hypothetical protein